MGCASSKNFITVHEVQVYGRRETSSQNCLEKCQKNPNHEGFFPVNDFSLEHLPIRYRDRNVLLLTQTLCQLTVKINATKVSAKRPETYPEKETAYPFHKQATTLRSGTGRICRVSRHENVPNEVCICKSCRNTNSPEVSWGEIFVVTATHVIYDQDEIPGASCVLNYDSPDVEYLTFDDLYFLESGVTDDKCWLRILTHDLQLISDLDQKVSRYDELCALLYSDDQGKETVLGQAKRLVIIVSHPHGDYKKVSVGEWTRRELVDKYYTQYTYNAMTCPGTSGATVYTFGMPGWFYVHTHSGADSGFGFSGYGFEH